MNKIENLPKGILTVDNPEHPFAFDGPDYLLSDRTGLLAIFELRENEQQNPSKLLSRLTNSLIAYPANTKMLLLLDKDISPNNNILQYGKLYFNEFIEAKDFRKAKSLLRDKKPDFKIKEIQKIQKQIFTIQSQVQKDNFEYINKAKFDNNASLKSDSLTKKATFYDRLNHKEVITRANIFEFENQYFGQKKLSKNASDIEELKPYYEFVINSEFIVDNGVPYFKHLSRKVLNVNEIPKIKFDPLKPLRIASLFGWHIINTNNFDEMENRISKFKR